MRRGHLAREVTLRESRASVTCACPQCWAPGTPRPSDGLRGWAGSALSYPEGLGVSGCQGGKHSLVLVDAAFVVGVQHLEGVQDGLLSVRACHRGREPWVPSTLCPQPDHQEAAAPVPGGYSQGPQGPQGQSRGKRSGVGGTEASGGAAGAVELARSGRVHGVWGATGPRVWVFMGLSGPK